MGAAAKQAAVQTGPSTPTTRASAVKYSAVAAPPSVPQAVSLRVQLQREDRFAELQVGLFFLRHLDAAQRVVTQRRGVLAAQADRHAEEDRFARSNDDDRGCFLGQGRSDAERDEELEKTDLTN